MKIEPEFDVGRLMWKWERWEGASIRELIEKIKAETGQEVTAKDYYSDGYSGKIKWPRSVSQLSRKIPLRMKAIPMPEPRKGMKKGECKYDHEKVLDLWASGMTGPEIREKLGIRSGGTIGEILEKARKRGDKRAERRIGR